MQGREGGLHDGIDRWACLDRRGLADRDLRLDLFEQKRAVGDSPGARPFLAVADRGWPPASDALNIAQWRGDPRGRPHCGRGTGFGINRARSGPILDRAWVRREPGQPQGSPQRVAPTPSFRLQAAGQSEAFDRMMSRKR